MLKVKRKQSGIERQIIESRILKSKKLFEDPDIITPMFLEQEKSILHTDDKIGEMPLEGGESPKLKTKVLELKEFDLKESLRLMLKNNMKGKGTYSYFQKINSIEELRRKSIEQDRMAES
jgi:hypothetical protein